MYATQKVLHLSPTERQVKAWAQEAVEGKRPLIFTKHVLQRMKQRRIGKRQVLETLLHGRISEPVHQDISGDWRCNLSYFHAGTHLTVGVAFATDEQGVPVIVLTTFKD